MYEVYTVKFGDTLDKILSMYGSDINELVRLNGIIDINNLKEGMQIMVPNSNKNPYRYYTVKKGDTILGIADLYNIDYKLLIKLNGLEENDYIYPNQTLIIPKEGVSIYITKDNDTINSIMNDLGMNLMELIGNNDNIYLREEQVIIY